MLDGKILVAVLATLAAAAAGLNGGSLDPGQLKSSDISAPGGASFNDFVPESLRGVLDLVDNPEPVNRFSASLQSENVESLELSVRNSGLEVNGLSRFNIGRRSVESSGPVDFYGFSGTVNPGETTELKGRAKGFYSNGVNVSGGLRLQKKLNTSSVVLEDVRRSSISLDRVTGSITSNSTTTRIKDPATGIRINSFSGEIRVYPGNGSVLMDGKVDTLDAGKVSFGQ